MDSLDQARTDGDHSTIALEAKPDQATPEQAKTDLAESDAGEGAAADRAKRDQTNLDQVRGDETKSDQSAAPATHELAKAGIDLVVGGIPMGDSDALARLAASYRDELVRHACYIVSDFNAAEDIAHNTLLRFRLYLHSFDNTLPLRPYLMRICQHEAYSWLTKHRPTNTVALGDDIGADAIWDQSPSPSDVLQDQDDWLKLLGLFNASKLTLRERLVVVYTVLEDFTYAETGILLGVAEKTVGSMKNSALNKLRESPQLQGYHDGR